MKTSLSETEYSELLQQTLAVWENAKLNIACRIATNASNAYGEIGQLVHTPKVDSKHGSGVVLRLSGYLKQRFPTMGCLQGN